jgi:hypothetical protein
VSMRRLVRVGTVLLVAALAAIFALVGWDQADRIAIVLGGLVAVAALGVAVWAALPVARSAGPQPPPTAGTTVGEEAAAPGREPTIEQHAQASDQAKVYQAGRDQHITGK